MTTTSSYTPSKIAHALCWVHTSHRWSIQMTSMIIIRTVIIIEFFILPPLNYILTSFSHNRVPKCTTRRFTFFNPVFMLTSSIYLI